MATVLDDPEHFAAISQGVCKMSRIKQEIDRAIEYYGDRANVFRVVRRGVRKAWARTPLTNVEMDWLLASIVNGRADQKPNVKSLYRKRYIYHIRRLLPIDRPVTTERLREAKMKRISNVLLLVVDALSEAIDTEQAMEDR